MRNRRYFRILRTVLCAVCLIGVGNIGTVLGETVVEAWKDVKTPPAPGIKPVVLDAATTALLLLDFNKQVCNEERRPRCIVSIPAVAKLAEKARGSRVVVVYSLTLGSSIGDVAPLLAARAGEPAVTSGPDKFLGTDLEKILREGGIRTVIVTGTAAHGAVLYTASGAALRGFKVILPVDGLSAEDLYPEQYTVWHLLNAPRVSSLVTVTRTDMITFR